MLSDKNNQGPDKFSPEDLKLVDELTEEYMRQKDMGGDDLYLNHLEWQMQGILDKNELSDENLYKTAGLEGEIDEDNEVQIELPEKNVLPDRLEPNEFQTQNLNTEELDDLADEVLLEEDCPETSYYNQIADLYEDYVSSFVEHYHDTPEHVGQRINVARRYFDLFDSKDIHNKFKKRKLKELVTDLYRDSIKSDIELDDFDKGFVKMAMLLQYRSLNTVDKKLKNMPFLGPISHASDEEFEAMMDIICYRYLGFYEQYVSNIKADAGDYIEIKDFDSANFDRYLHKFGYIFESDVKEEILDAIKEKLNHYADERNNNSFVNKAYLRAAAMHLSDDFNEYKMFRQKLRLGNADEFELELALPLMKEKMFVFMKYEEELKQSKTMTKADRQNVIDLSLVDKASLQEIEKRERDWKKMKTMREQKERMRQKDPVFWAKLESAFNKKKK